MKKRILSIVLIVALVATLTIGLAIGLAACNPTTAEREVKLEKIAKANIKVGLICLHDESSTYDKNFLDAMDKALTEEGLNKQTQYVVKKNVPEGPECYDAAVELVNQGCNIIFADSFGHEDYMMQAAWEFPTVRFCHATGTKARTANYGNYYNAFASIYEGRYLAGVMAGMKLKEMIDAGQIKDNQKDAENNIKVGYVGAFAYAEVISGYTSWFLGVRSVVSNVVMQVKYTGSWYDYDQEYATANTLIGNGCALISQHADSMGAPKACNEKGVPNITYNIATNDTGSGCANTYLGGSRINWAPYYEYVIEQAIAGEPIAYDYVGTLESGSVETLEIGSAYTNKAAVTAKIEEVRTKLLKGEIEVFDTEAFKVNGKKLTALQLADVVTDDAFTPDTFVVEIGTNGHLAFKESNKRSAPYFNVIIDGITILE